jgi:hypothetical protein
MSTTADSASVRNTAVSPQMESTPLDPIGTAMRDDSNADVTTELAQAENVDADNLTQKNPTCWALSSDTLTKLLDSARGEVRGYRSLYYALLGFGVLALSPITTLYRSTSCKGGSSWLFVLVAIWVLGIVALLFGSIAMLPRIRYSGSTVNEFEAINGVAFSIGATDDCDAQTGLIRAIRATHDIQHRVIERGKYVFFGALLIIISVLLAFVRWAMPCS